MQRNVEREWRDAVENSLRVEGLNYKAEPALATGTPDFLLLNRAGEPRCLVELKAGSRQLSATVVGQMSRWLKDVQQQHPKCSAVVVTNEHVPESLKSMAQAAGVRILRVDNSRVAAAVQVLQLARDSSD